MHRFNSDRALGTIGMFGGLINSVDCKLSPAGSQRQDTADDAWTQKRAEELTKQGYPVQVLHLAGQPPVVVYRT